MPKFRVQLLVIGTAYVTQIIKADDKESAHEIANNLALRNTYDLSFDYDVSDQDEDVTIKELTEEEGLNLAQHNED